MIKMEPGIVKTHKCLVLKTGKILNSDKTLIDHLKNHVHLQKVETVNECDFVLIFCPILSRARTDIDSAVKTLQSISDTKPAVLVVLHHTFDPECVVPNSSRAVMRKNTIAVDCLFYEDQGLLQCHKNEESLEKIVHYITTQAKEQCQKKKTQEGSGKLPGLKCQDTNTKLENAITELQERKGEVEQLKKRLMEKDKELKEKAEVLKECLKANEDTNTQLRRATGEIKKEKSRLENMQKLLNEKDTQLTITVRELEMCKNKNEMLERQLQVIQREKERQEKDRLLTENTHTPQTKDKGVGETDTQLKEEIEQDVDGASTELPGPKCQLGFDYNSLKNQDQPVEQIKRQVQNNDTELKNKNLTQDKGSLAEDTSTELENKGTRIREQLKTDEKSPSGRDAAVLNTDENHDNTTEQLKEKNSEMENVNKLMSEKEPKSMCTHLETSKYTREILGQELHDKTSQQRKESGNKTNSVRRCTEL